MSLEPKISHVTRHQGEGVVFQLHHFAGHLAADTRNACGKVFLELKDGTTRFTNGCSHRVAAMPEIKEAEPVPVPVADATPPEPTEGQKKVTASKAKQPAPVPEPVLLPAGAPK